MSLVCGLDVGTSGVKAVLIDERGEVKASASAPLELSTPKPGWAEQDPDAWWLAAQKALKQAVGPRLGKQVLALGLSGQMHSSVFLDRSSRVIRPALLWCDGRTSQECAELTAHVGESKLRRWVANAAFEGFTLPKILWLRRHEPGAFRKLAKVLLPKDYVRFCMTGVLATEPSDASATLLYDTARQKWSDAMLRATELPPALLPDVVPSAAVAGRLTREAARLTGLLEGTPIVAGGADNACGAIGVGAVRAGDVVVSWGTSGTVLAPLAAPTVDRHMRAHTFCHAVPDTWYAMGVMLTAGGAFDWYGRELARELTTDVASQLAAEAEAAPAGSEGVLFLPYLQGERTPHRNAAARAAFVGMSLAHQRAHLSRAVLEGICFGLRDSLEILAEMGVAPRSVLVTGGGAGSAFVRQLQADVFGKKLEHVRAQGPAFGAALLASVGAGWFRDVRGACRAVAVSGSTTAPDRRQKRLYDEVYQRYRALYPALYGKGR